jgi:hypothetical protein
MQKIRITKTPKTGDQRDFSLVHKQAHYINDGETVNPVKNTMGAVPIEQANIEVEGGETVVGDVNRDGFLEHMTFVGKRHSQGGMPVNIPEGSFIFSDTKKLKIKDKEILGKVFGLSAKKGGYTPAEIAKKYQINNYIHDLKSESSDPITKRSATQMLANNMEKLGMLALVQESMKGFPDGIPAIAESVMAGLQGGGAEEMPQGKFGGMMKAQKGGQKPTTGNQKLDALIFEYQKNPTEQKAKDLMRTIELSYGDNSASTWSPFPYNVRQINNPFAKQVYFEAAKYGQKPYDGRSAEQKDRDLAQTLKPQAQNLVAKLTKELEENKANMLPYEIKNKQSEIASIKTSIQNNKGSQLKTYLPGMGKVVGKTTSRLTPFNTAETNPQFDQPSGSLFAYTNQQKAKTKDNRIITVGFIEEENKWRDIKTNELVNFTPASKDTPSVSKPAIKQTATKPAVKTTSKPKTDADILSMFAMGGTLKEYQMAGEKVTTAPDEETLISSITREDGVVRNVFYTSTEKIVKDADGNVVARAPRTDKASYTPHQGDKNPSLNPITGQKETGWNKSKYTTDQIDALARERGYTGPKNNKALQEWILSKPEFSKVVEELHTKYKMPATGEKADGFWGVRWDDVLENLPPVPSTTTTPAPPPGTQQPPSDEGKKEEEKEPAMPQAPKKGPWWLQDITNFVGTLTDDINRYEPTQGRVALQTPGYVTLDPTRRLAANQEQFARMQQMTENTVDGNVGLASMTGTQGQSFANAANVLGDVENANVGIVNQAYNTNAQIMNQEAAANEVGRQKYVEDMATLNQQLDNAEQQNKWRQIAAFNNGTSNWFRKKQMEEVLFPDVYVDPILGDVSVDPSGRSLFGPDTYSPSYMDNRGGNNMMSGNAGIEQWNAIVQEATPIMGPEEAKKYATVYMGNQMRAQNRAVTGVTPRQQYNQMATQGLTLPLPPREFGGVVYFPWSDIE